MRRLTCSCSFSRRAAVLGLCLWQVRRGLSIQRRLLFVLVSWAVWQMTFGPATERTTFGLIAPLSSWGLATAFQQRRGRLLMTVAFVLMTCANFGVIERALMGYAPIILAAHPVGAMLFFGWFLDWNHWTADGPTPAAIDGGHRLRVPIRVNDGQNRYKCNGRQSQHAEIRNFTRRLSPCRASARRLRGIVLLGTSPRMRDRTASIRPAR